MKELEQSMEQLRKELQRKGPELQLLRAQHAAAQAREEGLRGEVASLAEKKEELRSLHRALLESEKLKVSSAKAQADQAEAQAATGSDSGLDSIYH